jgi:hypothetical protein
MSQKLQVVVFDAFSSCESETSSLENAMGAELTIEIKPNRQT